MKRTLLILCVLIFGLAACGSPAGFVPTATLAPQPTQGTLQAPEPPVTSPPAYAPTVAPVGREPATPGAAQPGTTISSPCAPSEDVGNATVAVTRDRAFCIFWADTFDDERGFRIVLEYLGGGERFTYQTEPDAIAFAVPDGDTPALEPASESCMARKDFMVTVVALRPGGDTAVGTMAGESECTPALRPTEPEPEAAAATLVYQVRADGSVRALRVDNGTEVVLADPTEPDQLLPWASAPDGRSIAVITGRSWNRKGGGSFTAALWTVSVDATQPRKLLDLLPLGYAPKDAPADSDLHLALIGPFARTLTWTPDGRTIVVASAHEGQVDLYAVAADGSGARRLTNTPAYETSASLSPDGRAVAYTSVASFGTGAGASDRRLWVQMLSDGEPHPVEGAPDEDSTIIGWAGDGTIVGMSGSPAEGSVTIWAAGPNSPPQIVHQGSVGPVAWSDRGGMLAFAAGESLQRQLFIWRMGEDQPAPGGALDADTWLDWSPDGSSLLVCTGDQIYGDHGVARARLMLWRDNALRSVGEGPCTYRAWGANGQLAVGGDGAGFVVEANAATSRLEEGAFPAGWHDNTLLFFVPLATNSARWQLYQAAGEQNRPIGAPIVGQPIDPMLVVRR